MNACTNGFVLSETDFGFLEKQWTVCRRCRCNQQAVVKLTMCNDDAGCIKVLFIF